MPIQYFKLESTGRKIKCDSLGERSLEECQHVQTRTNYRIMSFWEGAMFLALSSRLTHHYLRFSRYHMLVHSNSLCKLVQIKLYKSERLFLHSNSLTRTASTAILLPS